MPDALRVDNSPFSEQQLKLLQSSLGTLNPAQTQWLSGYLAGRAAAAMAAPAQPQAAAAVAATLAVVYATETGNSKAIATSLAANAEQAGIGVELMSADQLRPARLRKLERAVFVISTHGDGDPPDEALELFEYLESERAPQLPTLSYRVLALGDSSYPLFCEAGRRLDQRLQGLGARPFAERLECDVDYAANAERFTDEVLRFVGQQTAAQISATRDDQPAAGRLALVASEAGWSRQRPFTAEVTAVQRITGNDADKVVCHLELSLQGSGLSYQPGDSLGVWAPNDPAVTERILEVLQIDAADSVRVGPLDLSIAEALTGHLELTRLAPDTVRRFAAAAGRSDLAELFAGLDAAGQRAFIEERQFADLVEAYPARLSARELAELLQPLRPRSYSIASSQALVDDEVHLTVATLNSNAIGIPRQGVASGHLNHRVGPGGQVRVFLEPNDRFRLPADPAAPVIMIGAGTGIAPYRAFMQELESRGDRPDSWLIFGNTRLRNDFLYQREWLHWRATGLLKRIDAAWSRDQPQKRYVQDVVRERAELIGEWLRRGAHIYLCGSLKMGAAVQEALQDSLAGDPKAPAAALAPRELLRQRRLHKDLY